MEFYLSGLIPDDLKYELDHISSGISIYNFGNVSWEKNLFLVSNCNLVVSPTLVENFSNAFIEAFSLGVPIVTFDIGGNNEIIDNGINGFIVPYLDINQLIQKTIVLIQDKQLLQEFSNMAFQKSQVFSDIGSVLEDYSNIFSKVLANE